ncbi:autophagy-related 4a [Dermatophagoides pteronyssinus]|uniref:autophagy-related 4a n=1 Tax=Dermatophagoides pteronyssinus TaxID=6956 RepID=UPI003F6781DA
MDLYSTLNSLAPKISYLNRDFNHHHQHDDQSIDENPKDFPPTEDPVYILGKKYSSLYELNEIRSDVRSNIWMTYRRNFPPIGDTNFTSDSGWGCMLRCGQMVLARAFINLYLGRNWHWNYTNLESIKQLLQDDNEMELKKYLIYKNILKMFTDQKTSSYSIHQIALMGVCEGKNVGQWFGPNTIAQVLRKLSLFDKMSDVFIYVAMDNIVFLDDIKKSCKINDDDDDDDETKCQEITSKWKPLILFIPLRLGLTEINPVYFRALKTTFTFPQTLGILGGRPNHALYFIGCCGDDLIYLDPHTTQPNVNIVAQDREYLEQILNEEIQNDLLLDISSNNDQCITSLSQQSTDDISYHCERPYRMSISLLDPSLSLCFFCKNEEEFNHWTRLTMEKLFHEQTQPLFEIMQTRPREWQNNDDDDNDLEFIASSSSSSKLINQSFVHKNIPNDLAQQTSDVDNDDEEFEII